ncbi:hypothetical protein HNP84_000030 [Thermocatellispora tengchongensis]|uniref:Uncharacterized protein n=1 Tax=Thermocatellispora tengchongensis TaxID=1073253 RepID=A0A840NSW1_9ACTN|nr:DUF6069 family protein [Thermocatellispora tengchongensis]MBB5130342.1 hypothetical protein [Thermocatellispora tengchongensis]
MTQKAAGGGLRWRGVAAGVAGSVAAPLVVWAVAVPGAGVDLTVGTGPEALNVGVPGIVVSSLVLSLAGFGVLAVLRRLFPQRARTIWLVVAVVTVIGSLVPTLGAVTPAAVATLVAMHLSVGAVAISAVVSGAVVRDTAGPAAGSAVVSGAEARPE